MSLEEALKVLKTYSCIETNEIKSEIEKEKLRQALLLVTSLSDYENLGICADNSEQGFKALITYLKALGYRTSFNPTHNSSILSPVYIKFNTQKMSYYLDAYIGDYRGVLISCQSENDAIVGTYGHFPLNLFN